MVPCNLVSTSCCVSIGDPLDLPPPPTNRSLHFWQGIPINHKPFICDRHPRWGVDPRDNPHVEPFSKQKRHQQKLCYFSSWWLNQPNWKICSSNWIISPGFGVKIKTYVKPPPSFLWLRIPFIQRQNSRPILIWQPSSMMVFRMSSSLLELKADIKTASHQWNNNHLSKGGLSGKQLRE